MKKIKTLLVDDHQLLIDGLTQLFLKTPKIDLIDHATDGTDLLEKLKTQQPDLILLDIRMTDMHGIEAAKAVKELYPTIKVIMLTTYSKKEKVRAAIDAAVNGYVLKHSGHKILLEGIDTVMKGEDYYDKRIMRHLIDDEPKPSRKFTPTLTPREVEVTKLIALGKSYPEIAAKLCISLHTVKAHCKNIFSKLGIHDKLDLALYAYKTGLVKLPPPDGGLKEDE